HDPARHRPGRHGSRTEAPQELSQFLQRMVNEAAPSIIDGAASLSSHRLASPRRLPPAGAQPDAAAPERADHPALLQLLVYLPAIAPRPQAQRPRAVLPGR